MEAKSVSSRELGCRCIVAKRFIKSSRCPRVMRCKYPEKKTCKAVQFEIEWLQTKLNLETDRINRITAKLQKEQANGTH